MQVRPPERYRISADVLSQEVNGETVLLNLQGEAYFGLNEVGTRIWQLLQSGRSAGEIMTTLLDEYDVPRRQLEQDVSDLLTRLLEAGLVEAGE
jgi:hypothetical protein